MAMKIVDERSTVATIFSFDISQLVPALHLKTVGLLRSSSLTGPLEHPVSGLFHPMPARTGHAIL